ncbi:MAG: hypothetical protein ACF8TS_12240 [Maioricimonas sp. JB049]
MSSTFEELAALHVSDGPLAAIDRLIDELREQKQYHKLFDARLLRRKFELGLPVDRPASLQDVPDDQRKAVEETYVEAAREVGALFLEQDDIPSAWMYLQVIREPQKVAEAIDRLPVNVEPDEKTEELLNIAVFQGVNPVKGVQMMLRCHGTCSTITSLEQALQNMTSEQRQDCAKVLVRSLYQDLQDSVRRHVEQRMPMLPPDATLRELITGRDWLFEGGNYHIDTSHLNAVVRFARSIEPPADELDLTLQLCEYGAKLDPQLQYGGEPPFVDFYPAHEQFFKAVLGQNQDQALQYFRDQLDAEPDEQDKPLLAYVLVDLLMRTERLDEAVDVAAEYLSNLSDDMAFSFAELCRKANRLDVLQKVTQDRGDLVGFAAALLQPAQTAEAETAT